MKILREQLRHKSRKGGGGENHAAALWISTAPDERTQFRRPFLLLLLHELTVNCERFLRTQLYS